MKLFYLLCTFSIICIFYGCKDNMDIQDKFELLKEVDYSKFSNVSVVNRKGTYYIEYHNIIYKIKMCALTDRVLTIERINDDSDKTNTISKETISFIENVLKSFREMEILSLSVDAKGNIYLAVPWSGMCTYYFLRLAPDHSLIDIKKQNYKHYDANWYIDKECAE